MIDRTSRHCGRALALLLASASPLRAMQQDSSTARIVIVVDSLDRAAFANVAEILQARVPGLHISRTGDGGMRWFMRGPSSGSESTPMVLVDDARLNVAGSAGREIGTRLPLLDDIDIEDVERIELWSGAATVAGHGSGAGHGVLRIVTFAPRAQKMSLRVAAAAGTMQENVAYPANYARPGIDSAGAPVSRCTLRLEASGWCTPTGPPTSINVLESESPFETAVATQVSAALASGNDWLAWRSGVTFDRQGSTAGHLANQRFHLRGAASLRRGATANFTLRARWMRGDADLPAFHGQSLLQQGLFARADTQWLGFTRPPLSTFAATRYGVNATAGWRPRTWFDARLTSGVEGTRDEDDADYLLPVGGGFGPFQVNQRGERRRRDLTVRADAEARYGAGILGHATTVTIERAESRHEEEFSERLQREDQVGARSFSTNRLTEITGVGVVQRLHLRQRATLTAGLRLDRVEMSEVRWDVPVSPHISLSWDARGFAPTALGGIRLRASLGDVANVPQTTWSAIGFVPISPSGPDQPKAEVTRERELGLEATGVQDRLRLSLTWYNKRTNNVGSLSPDPLFGGRFRFAGIEMLNRGIEASLRAEILERDHLAWEARAWYSYNHNEVRQTDWPHPVLFIGEVPVGGRQFVLAGQPLGGYRNFAVGSIRDLDGDGVIDSVCLEGGGMCEVTLTPLGEFLPAFPPRSASIETSFRLGRLRVTALVDHRSGHGMHNSTMEMRCFTRCQALYDPSSSLEAQAEALLAPWIVEDASYTRLREISLRLTTPARWAHALGSSRLDLSVAARNVATWTNYAGLDPEATSLPWIPLAQVDNAAMPLPRRFLVRIDWHGG
jgi:hypothetical protein